MEFIKDSLRSEKSPGVIKIGYNSSINHSGIIGHCESPDRIEYCIKELQKVFTEDMFVNSILDRRDWGDVCWTNPGGISPKLRRNEVLEKLPPKSQFALQMIMNVHSEEYINSLINIAPNIINCKSCKKKIHANANFENFLAFNETCPHCDVKLELTNIVHYFSSDTYYTPYTFDIILEAIHTLKVLVDNIKFAGIQEVLTERIPAEFEEMKFRRNSQQINYGYALIRPPGHHCCNSPEGFCIVNNAVIAAKYAQSIGYKKVFILDIDFHHGDGTEELINSMDNIYLASIHGYGENIYPGTGIGMTDKVINIPLAVTKSPKSRLYITDEYYINIIRTLVLPFITTVSPDFIIISNGMDGHKDDPLEGFNITDDTFVSIAKILKELELPLLFVTEGGYSAKVLATVSKKIIDVFL